jgi:predicted neuraminidase
VLSEGGVQPSLIRRKDGTLVAYMRDNGPPPKRVLVSTSADDGITWTTAVDSDIPNPGASVEVIALRDGSWLMVLNDTEKGRHSLAVWLSEDEGRTWPYKRHLEHDTAKTQPTTASYPSVIQSKDGLIHVTYTYTRGARTPGEPYETIKHVRFPVEWVREGR